MIRKNYNKEKWLLTPQAEHARLSGLIAASWNFPGDKPGDEVTKAIMRHDDGWREADESPVLNRNAEPSSFEETGAERARDIWTKSIDLLAEDGKIYGAAMVSEHFHTIAKTADLTRMSVKDTVALGKFIAERRTALKKFKSAINNDEVWAGLERDVRFLQVCDLLSLLVCTDFTGEQVIPDVPYLAEGTDLKASRKVSNLSLTLDPLPFKKNVRDHLASSLITKQAFENADQLKETLAETKPTTNEVHFGAA